MSQMRGVSILVRRSTGLAMKREILMLCFSPMVLGMISAKMMTRNVSEPEMMATIRLGYILLARTVTMVVPPMFAILFSMTMVDMGRLILSWMVSSALVARLRLALMLSSSAICRTFIMGTENSAASVPEQSAEMRITIKAAINMVVINI